MDCCDRNSPEYRKFIENTATWLMFGAAAAIAIPFGLIVVPALVATDPPTVKVETTPTAIAATVDNGKKAHLRVEADCKTSTVKAEFLSQAASFTSSTSKSGEVSFPSAFMGAPRTPYAPRDIETEIQNQRLETLVAKCPELPSSEAIRGASIGLNKSFAYTLNY